MKRKIEQLHQHEDGDWYVTLDCGHEQRVRHIPPLYNRPWLLTPEGREQRKGKRMNCRDCDESAFPYSMERYERTPEYSDMTYPREMQKFNSTPVGVWGKIHVLKGSLLYEVIEPSEDIYIVKEHVDGIVVPETKYRIIPQEDTSFYLEYYRKQSDPLPVR